MKKINDEFYEIRIFLIGDLAVGKRSITQRFKKLNTTETTKDKFFISKDPRDAYGIGKKINKKLASQYNSLNVMDKFTIRKEIERIDLMTFSKQIIVNKYNIILNFFPICEAEKIDDINSDLIREDDEDYNFVQKYHISLKNVKKEIQTYLFKNAKNSNSTLESLFLFIFDLQDYSTFERLQIYYDQLEKYFQINNNYLKALIGNKCDIKIKLKPEQKQNLDNFISKNNFKFYEISTFMFFNFELFFENLFKDILSSLDEGFSDENFLNRFHLLLSKRPNLSKAEREYFKINDTPGPGEYKNDIYDYPKEKDIFMKTFSNLKGGRFVTNIFIDKQGPIFPNIIKENIKQKEKKKKDDKNKTQINFGDWDSKNKKEIKEALETNIPGFSLGIKKGNYNFKQKRKEESKNREKELEDAILENTMTLHIKKEPILKQIKDFSIYDEDKKENLKELINRIKEKEDEGKDKIKDNLKLIENLHQQKIKEIQEKQEKYQKKYEEREREMNRTRSGLYHPRSQSTRLIKRKFSPSEKLYDIRTKYDPNKGWSFGVKYNINPNKNKDDPDFPNLLTDFDKITLYPKHAEIKYTSPRFKEITNIKPHTAKIRDNYITDEKREKIRKNGERNKILKTFINDRQKDLERVLENKAMLEQENQAKIEDLISKIPRSNTENNEFYDYYINNINYTQVEDRSPNYTMKGRYQHGSIFDINDNYDSVNGNNIDEENLGSNGKPIQDEKYLNSLTVPQFNFVKNNSPSFSFSQSNRFVYKNKYQEKPNSELILPFENGIFSPSDKVSFMVSQNYMGTGKKKNLVNPSFGPGPGYYKLKGFADVIVEEGMKISKVREEIIQKKKREENEKMGIKDFGKEKVKEKKERKDDENGEEEV